MQTIKNAYVLEFFIVFIISFASANHWSQNRMDRTSLSEAEVKRPPYWNSTVQWLSSREKEAQAVHQTVNENKALVGCTDTSPNVASTGFTVHRIRLQRCTIHSIFKISASNPLCSIWTWFEPVCTLMHVKETAHQFMFIHCTSENHSTEHTVTYYNWVTHVVSNVIMTFIQNANYKDVTMLYRVSNGHQKMTST